MNCLRNAGGHTSKQFALVATALVLACNSCGRPQAPVDPQTAFSALEQRLLAADTVEVSFQITSEGAMPSSLVGTLVLTRGNVMRLQAKGEFAHTPIDASLESDGQTLEGGATPDAINMDTPPALHEAVAIGMTRMGLLHNLAMLTGNAAPDHAEGGVQDWVQVSNFAPAVGLENASDVRITFDLIVAGTPSGSATLFVDGATGLPVAREQTVQFDTSEMRVLERYTVVRIVP